MRECKKCKITKFDFQMYKNEYSCLIGNYYQTIWLCKKCAKLIGDKAGYKAIKKVSILKKFTEPK